MKTIIKLLMTVFFIGTGLEYANAQSTASSNKESISTDNPSTNTENVVQQKSNEENSTVRGIRTPTHIDDLFMQGKVTEALNEFEKFKTTQKNADPFNLMYLEMTIYRQAAEANPTKADVYIEKMDNIIQQLIKKYPTNSDVYLLQIKPNSSDNTVIDLATMAIKADSTNESAYAIRANALFNIGKTKEACIDLEKLPYKKYMSQYGTCLRLKEDSQQK